MPRTTGQSIRAARRNPARKALAADEDGTIRYCAETTRAVVLTVAVALEGKDAVSAAFATVLRASLLNLDHLLEALRS